MLIVAKDFYPPFRVDVVDLFSGHLAKQYDLTWLMRANQPGPSHIARSGSEAFHVIGQDGGSGKRFRRIAAFAGAHASMLKRVLKGEFDVVQCRDTLLISPLYTLAARWAKSGACYWMSFPMEDSIIARGRAKLAPGSSLFSKLNGLARLANGHASRLALYRITLPLVDQIFVQSRRMKQDVAACGIAEAKLHPVPMGVNTQKYDGAVAPLPDAVYGNKRVLLYVGTLDAARRMEVPGRAAAMVLQRHPDAVFSLIGQASQAERDQVLAPARELGVEDRVIFHDHMPLSDVFSHIRRADVCLAPYPPEPRMLASATPTKTIEYVYLGAPVVANRHPDQEEVLQGAQTGVLTDFTAESFAQGIEELLAQPRAPEPDERAANWVRANRSYTALAGEVGAVYDRLIAKVRGRAA